MILQALNAYYERLMADPDVEVAEYGFSQQQIAFCVVLNADGSLHEIRDERLSDDKGKLRNQSLVVPGNSKPSGSGINPCLLWDNAAYLLGYKADDPKPERTRESFEAFRDKHLALERQIDTPAFQAVCRFLESWQPDTAVEHPLLAELKTGFGVFRLRGDKQYVHEDATIVDWFRGQLVPGGDSDAVEAGQCLITGASATIARLHEPKIKGVWGAQSSGAALVSFNCDAFESYGKAQSSNSPVSERAAFQYTTALNYLLAPGSKRRLSVGDTTVVCWTAEPSPMEDWFTEFINPSASAEDATQLGKVRPVLDATSQGAFPPELGPPDTPFYVLGLAPNAARISVRFWYVSTVGQFVERVRQHFADLAICRGQKDLTYPPLWRLLRETVREAKEIPDLLEGALMRAILTGEPYPQMFYSALLRRIRADREVRFVRAAAIKACLIRNYHQEVPMALDPDRPEPAYHLGRLFAEFEKTQEDALPGINDTIKDRYFGAASSTPASVFPRLIRMNQHHLGKLEKGNRTYHDRRIQEIASKVDGFSSHLSIVDQGLFAIGYYHQRRDIFTKKADDQAA